MRRFPIDIVITNAEMEKVSKWSQVLGMDSSAFFSRAVGCYVAFLDVHEKDRKNRLVLVDGLKQDDGLVKLSTAFEVTECEWQLAEKWMRKSKMSFSNFLRSSVEFYSRHLKRLEDMGLLEVR